MRGTLLILPILALLSWAACSEQSSNPVAQGTEFQSVQPRDQLQDSFAMEGNLTKVDSVGKRISIRMADGSERSFQYFDQTLVTGAEDSVEGLDKVNGARVRIQYMIGAEGNTVEEIEVLTGQVEDPADNRERGKY